MLLLLLFLPLISCSVCPTGTGNVFFVDRLSDNNNHCFEHCAQSNCTGVLVSEKSCISIHTANYYGPIEENKYVPKHCVQEMPPMTIVALFTDRVLLDHTERIYQAADKYHCIAKCTSEKDFVCLSAMFYTGGDCLLNSANSDTVAVLKDTEGFAVTYAERRMPVTTPCSSSFTLLPWNSKPIRGDAELFNTTSLEHCTFLCTDCDMVLYNEAFSECFAVRLSSTGQPLDFISEEYQVLESLCIPQVVECTPETSMYVSYKGFPKNTRRTCLKSCIASNKCTFAYEKDGVCTVSDKQLHLPKTIERICPSTGAMETEGCPSTPGSMKVKNGMNLRQCMEWCLEHPTHSCDAIAHHTDTKLCEVYLTSQKVKPSKKSKRSSSCRHFTLNIISLGREKLEDEKRTEGTSSGKTKPKKQPIEISKKKAKVHAAKKLNIHKISAGKIHKPSQDLSVETICNYHEIVVRITSPDVLKGEIFARNAHDTCSVSVKGENMAELKMNLTRKSCNLQRDGSVYRGVIVVKQNSMSDMPIITETDRLYSVTCDYSSSIHNTTMTAVGILKLKDSKYHKMAVPGKVPYASTMKMELRPKRNKLDDYVPSKANSVSLGQQLDLVFHQDKNISADYFVSGCIATTQEGNDNLTLVENGCPTRSAREYIVRGGIRRTESGFSLPLRAFKFRQGDAVRIACTLQMCDKCKQPSCDDVSIRHRRNLAVSSWPTEDVVVAMLVREQPLANKEVCFPTVRFSVLSAVAAMMVILQTLALVFIRRKMYSD